MTTISDVAKHAGVSPATVSRVLNDTVDVSPALAARVRAAVAELDYVPFSPARALRTQLTNVWAVIVADIQNPFFTSVVRGIEDCASARGTRVVLCNSDENTEKEAEYIEVAIRERMAGVIISISGPRSNLDPLRERGIPVVAVDRRPADERVDRVLADNRAGALRATAHLIGHGAERVACVTGPAGLSTADERLAGYKEALSQAGRAYDPALVLREDFRPPGGAEAVKTLFGGCEPPDGLFVTNNQMTIGALHALGDLGVDVPGDVRVVGYDDSPWATLVRPRLTVVSQPTYDIGRSAAELLVSARERQDESARHVVLDPTLLVRESSVPAESADQEP